MVIDNDIRIWVRTCELFQHSTLRLNGPFPGLRRKISVWLWTHVKRSIPNSLLVSLVFHGMGTVIWSVEKKYMQIWIIPFECVPPSFSPASSPPPQTAASRGQIMECGFLRLHCHCGNFGRPLPHNETISQLLCWLRFMAKRTPPHLSYNRTSGIE